MRGSRSAYRTAVAALFVTLAATAFAATAAADEYTYERIAGTGPRGTIFDSPIGLGGPARDATLGDITDVDLLPDGSIIMADHYTVAAYRVTPAGTLVRYAGNGGCCLFNYAENVLAISTHILRPYSIAAAADGSGYFDEVSRIRRVSSAGIMSSLFNKNISTPSTFSGDGGPALNATPDPDHSSAGGFIAGVAVGPDGSIYFADGGSRIRRITTDGIVRTVAGTGTRGYSGDGGHALAANISASYLDVDDQGQIVFLDDNHHRVRLIDPDGVIRTIAGNGQLATVDGQNGEGGAAVAATLGRLYGIGFTSKGVVISEFRRLRRINSDGTIETIAGNGQIGLAPDGAPATTIPIGNGNGGVVEGPDGSIYAGGGNEGIIFALRRTDIDDDGVTNGADNCPLEANRDQRDLDGDGLGDPCDPDRDGDAINDTADNCTEVPNADQADQDRDGDGDACDPDRDGDEKVDDADNCPDSSNPRQEDQDGDGMGDLCDADRDGDVVPDDSDNCVAIANPGQEDGDFDGVGDLCDPDRDGDGHDNTSDNCPDAPNPDQADRNGNDEGDVCDAERPPAQQIADLIDIVEQLAIPDGTQRSLLAKLRSVQEAYNAARTQAGCGKLAAFTQEVTAQSGKKIPAADAHQLLDAAEEIAIAIGC